MSIEIDHEASADGGRYHLRVDGTEAGELDYRTVEGRRVFTHTGVRDEHEGQGLAGKLAERVLVDARAEGVMIVPQCPYVRSYLERHPEHADLVDQAFWEQLGGS
jgi:predicted GNAT family acetyltransferase